MFAAFAAFAARAGAESRTLPEPGDPAWRRVEFPSIPDHTRYDALADADGPVWRATGVCSASGRALALDGIDLEATPILRWRWKVDRPLPRLEETTKAGDDFAARVYVLFRFDPEQASWMDRLKRSAARALYDTDLPGGALNYVWSSSQARGATWQSPYQATSRMVALRTRADEGWFEEEVDLAEAQRLLIPTVTTPVVGIAIMTDSDQSCSETTAWYADLRFEARSAAPPP